MRKWYVKDLSKIQKCPHCNNGELEDCGDSKTCNWCETIFIEGSNSNKREKVNFT